MDRLDLRSGLRGEGRISNIPAARRQNSEAPIRAGARFVDGRGRLDGAEINRCLEHLREDLDGARLAATPLDLFRVFERALELSRAHAVTSLSRSLDLLHVAGALDLRCKRFVSGDDRQLELAKAAGFESVDVKTSGRR